MLGAPARIEGFPDRNLEAYHALSEGIFLLRSHLMRRTRRTKHKCRLALGSAKGARSTGDARDTGNPWNIYQNSIGGDRAIGERADGCALKAAKSGINQIAATVSLPNTLSTMLRI